VNEQNDDVGVGEDAPASVRTSYNAPTEQLIRSVETLKPCVRLADERTCAKLTDSSPKARP
jgi:hypothetical protein